VLQTERYFLTLGSVPADLYPASETRHCSNPASQRICPGILVRCRTPGRYLPRLAPEGEVSFDASRVIKTDPAYVISQALPLKATDVNCPGRQLQDSEIDSIGIATAGDIKVRRPAPPGQYRLIQPCIIPHPPLQTHGLGVSSELVHSNTGLILCSHTCIIKINYSPLLTPLTRTGWVWPVIS